MADQTPAQSEKQPVIKCAVPMCNNSTLKTPEKEFFLVPRNKEVRKQWIFKIKRINKRVFYCKKTIYFCQDHFDLETNTMNFEEHKLTGEKMVLKGNANPDNFECQKSLNDLILMCGINKLHRVAVRKVLIVRKPNEEPPKEPTND